MERETAHLPGTIAGGRPVLPGSEPQHHAAMLVADVDTAMRLHKEAGLLAVRLNDGEAGILAGPDAPGHVLARETVAAPGEVWLWGQAGEFIITVDVMKVRIELEGMFGIGSGISFWPEFAVHAVDQARPFLSQTGYRSFLGIHAERAPGAA